MKEEDIRPKSIFDEYIRLASEDVIKYFNKVTVESINCPACSERGEFSFIKNEFSYQECQNCHTIFASPRPLSKYFNEYYTESESAKYWASTFYKETAEARRKELWKPKSQKVLSLLKKHATTDIVLYDIGGGYGIFAEEMIKLGVKTRVIEPSPYLAQVCNEKGILTIEKFLEEIQISDLSSKKKAFVSFELFEHLHNPKDFLEKIYKLMNCGDILILTTLSSLGLDIQILWENSKSITPPYHINFFNPHSIQILNNEIGFITLEVTTPGKLDIDILMNSKDLIKDKFWKNFITHINDDTKEKWQTLLADTGWSSHMMVVCKK
jgi:hypothetical protein